MEDDAITPKKYIRTLEGDMAVLKKGGTPDFSLLNESEPSATERLVAPSPEIVEQIPVPSSLAPEPEQQFAVEPSPAPEPPKNTPLETYAGDFSDRMKKENASPITVLAAEQDAQSGRASPEPVKHSRSNMIYVVVGAILLIASGSGVYVAYTRYAISLVPIILAPVASAPIFVDDRQEIVGTGATLLEAIEQSDTRALAPNTVRFLYTTSATTTDNSVFSALQVPAPDILLRNINAEGSMAGIVNVGGAQSPFFILSVTSYSDTFSGMLKWEPTMPSDLGELFPAYPAIASSTATTTVTTAATVFHDEVVGNHDVRVYRDSAGRSILLYGYWNQTTLIIARDANAFTELLNRLATSQAQQ